ncbi:MAG: amidohydrolase [Promethearchaeota archaeon]|nr:MAG: amidohydrolase [Candidatus Lokiarchaeota archaeon]
MKIDFHCHIFKESATREALNTQFSQFKGYGFFERIKNGVKDVPQYHNKDIFEKTLYYIKKRANLDKVVLLPLSMNENEKVFKWCEQAPDTFIPFFNPPEKPIKGIDIEQLLVNVIKINGIKGLKIMNPFRNKFLNDKGLYPSFELAQEHNLLILMHTGYPPPGTKKNVLSYANPLKIEDIIQSFPKLRIIIAHMGFPWVDNALALAVQYPNIYLDISNLPYMMPNRLKTLLLRARELIGLDKILFGSDGFIPEMIEFSVNQVERIDYLSKEEISKIMGLNAKNLLKL